MVSRPYSRFIISCALHEQESKGDAWNDFLSQSRMLLQVSKLLTSMFSTCLGSTAMLFTSHFLLLLLSNFNEFVEASPIF